MGARERTIANARYLAKRYNKHKMGNNIINSWEGYYCKCKECGADIELKSRRAGMNNRYWTTGSATEEHCYGLSLDSRIDNKENDGNHSGLAENIPNDMAKLINDNFDKLIEGGKG